MRLATPPMTRILAVVAATASFALAAAPAAAQGTALERRAQEMADLITADATAADSTFAPSFLAQLPAARMSDIARQIHAQYGEVTRWRLVEAAPTGFSGRFTFVTERGFEMPVELAVSADPPHRVTGIFFRPGVPMAADWSELDARLDSLPGTTSMLVAELTADGLRPIHAVRADEQLAIGSAFKLWVLAELAAQIEAGERESDDVVALPDSPSLPSGILQDWPAGAPVTLHTLATLMISISDNTATDALIGQLGREALEARVAAIGHARPALNQPFLTTRELFVLKAPAERSLAERWLGADPAARRALLRDEVADRELALAMWERPFAIDRIEWFASAYDLARTMAALHRIADGDTTSPALRIMAVNPALTAAEDWPYVGYKGGSEPGVLALAWLALTPDGRWLALTGTWNDPDAALDHSAFVALLERAATLAAGGATP